ncbi:hypothetical protein L1887_36069 [Cichorium endivia]|nr:hypothetical protein L1887_36069 [Cichorium endivia]
MGDCMALKQIDLSNNTVNGTMSIELFKLTNLTELWLNNNMLSGTTLVVDFYGNHFNEEIPVTFGNCHQLTSIDLADNRLTGGISATFVCMRSLEQLMLYNNSLQGNLPPELTNLTDLTTINLINNKLNESISHLCSLSSFLSFDVTNNEFSDEIPTKLGNSQFLHRENSAQDTKMQRLSFLFITHPSFQYSGFHLPPSTHH